MTGYRCDTGACPQVTYTGDTVTIVENANPEQVVVTPRASWDAYLDTVRAQERAAIVAWMRAKRRTLVEAAGQLPESPFGDQAELVATVADLIERGEHADLAAGGDGWTAIDVGDRGVWRYRRVEAADLAAGGE